MITERIELIENRSDVTLTAYVLEDSPELLKGRKRPAVLVCPGGGYMNCSDREAEPVALRFAAMGYHAFVLRYSTYGRGVPGFFPSGKDMPPSADTMHPAPMRDIGRAFLEIRRRADDWLVDADKIAVCGFSAGAHNCAMYSVSWNDPAFCGYFGREPEAFKPAAAILGYGISDYRLMLKDFKDVHARALSEAATVAFFGTKDPTETALDEASPALRVTKACPPVFLWATAGDTLVPVENTTRMAGALARAGVPFEVHIFEKGPHGLSLADQSSAGSLFEMDEVAARWTDLAEAWLKPRFALSLPREPAWKAALEGRS